MCHKKEIEVVPETFFVSKIILCSLFPGMGGIPPPPPPPPPIKTIPPPPPPPPPAPPPPPTKLNFNFGGNSKLKPIKPKSMLPMSLKVTPIITATTPAAPATAVLISPPPVQPVSVTPVPQVPQPEVHQLEMIIGNQQKQIEQLQLALQRSQQQLLQQMPPVQQQQQQLIASKVPTTVHHVSELSNNSVTQPSNGGSSMKLILNQQLQNKQLQNQIHQLQASQAQVLSVLNQQYSGSVGTSSSEHSLTQPSMHPVITEVSTMTTNVGTSTASTSTSSNEDVFEVIMQQQNGEFLTSKIKCVSRYFSSGKMPGRTH